jgi:hypothetical protein
LFHWIGIRILFKIFFINHPSSFADNPSETKVCISMTDQLATLVAQLKERRAFTFQERTKSLDIRDEIWRKCNLKITLNHYFFPL